MNIYGRSVNGAEVRLNARLLARNCFSLNRYGVWLMRVWRLLNGNYQEEFLDGIKWKGRKLPL